MKCANPECSKEFNPNRKDKIYCSTKCQSRHRYCKNIDLERELARKNYIKKRTKYLLYAKKYYHENKDKRSKYYKKWIKDNKSYKTKYYLKNKKKCCDVRNSWANKNREKIRLSQRKDRDLLVDSYIKRTIKQCGEYQKEANITQEMIDQKRLKLKITRKIKQLTK